jgi:hypothetical protein
MMELRDFKSMAGDARGLGGATATATAATAASASAPPAAGTSEALPLFPAAPQPDIVAAHQKDWFHAQTLHESLRALAARAMGESSERQEERSGSRRCRTNAGEGRAGSEI